MNKIEMPLIKVIWDFRTFWYFMGLRLWSSSFLEEQQQDMQCSLRNVNTVSTVDRIRDVRPTSFFHN